MVPAMPRQQYGQRHLLRRLLVPLDGSPDAEWALPWGRGLAAISGASLLLITVVPQKLYGLGLYEGLPQPALDRSVVAQAAGDYLDDVRKQLASSVAVEASVLKGAAAPAIVQYGVRQGVDMVIMSTHGYQQPSPAILANTIDRVVRSGLPVLIVPPEDQRPRLSSGQMLAQPAILAAA
jgi:nucleotide-binding universal stress UspA family protein